MSAIAIVGSSGTGKSTSYGQLPSHNIKGLDPKETVIINVTTTKDLPIPGWKKNYKGKLTEGGNYLASSDATTIAQALTYIDKQRPDIANVVIDDGQYIMAFEFMQRAKENGYTKFADIGVNMNKIISAARMSQRVRVFFMWHPEVDAVEGYKMKTVGKMVDTYLTLEGLFTVVLYSTVRKEEDKLVYRFITNNNGEYPAKSPLGMFNDLYIPNDLGYVVEQMEKYYNE